MHNVSGKPTPPRRWLSGPGQPPRLGRCLRLAAALWPLATTAWAQGTEPGAEPVYQMRPIGWVRKADGKTSIEIDPKYQAGLLGVA
jgi:hypothetical protein